MKPKKYLVSKGYWSEVTDYYVIEASSLAGALEEFKRQYAMEQPPIPIGSDELTNHRPGAIKAVRLTPEIMDSYSFDFGDQDEDDE